MKPTFPTLWALLEFSTFAARLARRSLTASTWSALVQFEPGAPLLKRLQHFRRDGDAGKDADRALQLPAGNGGGRSLKSKVRSDPVPENPNRREWWYDVQSGLDLAGRVVIEVLGVALFLRGFFLALSDWSGRVPARTLLVRTAPPPPASCPHAPMAALRASPLRFLMRGLFHSDPAS